MSKGNSLLDKINKINATSETAITRVNEMNQVEEKRPRDPRSEVIENFKSKSYTLEGNLGVNRAKQKMRYEDAYTSAIDASFLLYGDLRSRTIGTKNPTRSKFAQLILRGYGDKLKNLFKKIVTDFCSDTTQFPKFEGVYVKYIGGYSRSSQNGVTFRYSSELGDYLTKTEDFLGVTKQSFKYVPDSRKEEEFISTLQTYIEKFEEANSLSNEQTLNLFWNILPFKQIGTEEIYICDQVLHTSFQDLVTTTFSVGLLESLQVGGFKELYLPISILEEILNKILGADNWVTFTSNVFKLPCSLKNMTETKAKDIMPVTSIPRGGSNSIYLCRCIYVDVLGNCTYAQVETIPNYGAEENGIVTIKNLAKRAAITQTFSSLESIRGPTSKDQVISGDQLRLVGLLDGIIGITRTIATDKSRGSFLCNMMNTVTNSNVKDITNSEIRGPEGDLITQGFLKSNVNKQLQIEGGRNTIRVEDLIEPLKSTTEEKSINEQQRKLQLVSSTKQPMEVENTTQMEEEQSRREEKED